MACGTYLGVLLSKMVKLQVIPEAWTGPIDPYGLLVNAENRSF